MQGGVGSIPGRGTKIPHVSRHGQKTNKQKKTTTAMTTAMMLLCDLRQFKLSELQFSNLPRDVSVPFWSRH